MNKKGFTLIELIAVVVIMSIIALIATPNIVSMIDKGKKSDYIADVNEFISKATYLYKQEKYRTNEEYFVNGKITLDKLDIKEEDKVDPYGYYYVLEGEGDNVSYIQFIDPTGDLGERKVNINIISCKDPENITESCYIINKDNIGLNELVESDVKGT